MFGQLFCLPPNTRCPLTQWHLCTFRSYFRSFPLLCLLCFKFGVYIVQQNIIVFLIDVLVWHGHVVHFMSLLFHGNSGYVIKYCVGKQHNAVRAIKYCVGKQHNVVLAMKYYVGKQHNAVLAIKYCVGKQHNVVLTIKYCVGKQQCGTCN